MEGIELRMQAWRVGRSHCRDHGVVVQVDRCRVEIDGLVLTQGNIVSWSYVVVGVLKLLLV